MERASYDRPATTAKGSLPGFRMSAAGGVRAATVQRQGPRRACSVGRVLRRFYEQGETSLSATPVAPPARGLRRLSVRTADAAQVRTVSVITLSTIQSPAGPTVVGEIVMKRSGNLPGSIEKKPGGDAI